MAIENDKLTREQLIQLRALLNLEKGLDDFEVNFIESISHQTYALTAKQAMKLSKIYSAKG